MFTQVLIVVSSLRSRLALDSLGPGADGRESCDVALNWLLYPALKPHGMQNNVLGFRKLL